MEDRDWETVNTLALGLHQIENWYARESLLCRQITESYCGGKNIKECKYNSRRLISLAAQEWFIITSVHPNKRTKQEIYAEQDFTQGLTKTRSSKTESIQKMYSMG